MRGDSAGILICSLVAESLQRDRHGGEFLREGFFISIAKISAYFRERGRW
jgi:hypothetical protein